MAEIRVTPQQLKDKATTLEGLNKKFRAQVETMVGYESQLASMWEGESQRAFRKAFGDDKVKWNAFAENIDKYVQALREDAQRYETAENAATNIATTRKA